MDDHKRVLMVWHRRAGKDKLCLNKLVARAAETKANFAYYMPTAALGRKALWMNVDVTNGMRVIDHIPKELLAKPPNQTDMRIELINGSTIQILGTDNLDVVGGNYYGVVFSEYQNQNPLAWDYTRPILAENGGFAWFNGTPRGENHFHDMLKMAKTNDAWFAQVLTCDDTQAITAEQIDEERKSGMSEALIRQEFYCDFSVSNENAIYGRELMPSFEWRLPACETGVKGVKAYEMASDSSSGIVRNVPLHTWASHVADGIRTMAEADRLGLIHSGSGQATSTRRRSDVQDTN